MSVLGRVGNGASLVDQTKQGTKKNIPLYKRLPMSYSSWPWKVPEFLVANIYVHYILEPCLLGYQSLPRSNIAHSTLVHHWCGCLCGHHVQKIGHQPVMVANPARGELNTESCPR